MISSKKYYRLTWIGLLSLSSQVIFADQNIIAPPVKILTETSISSSTAENPIPCTPAALANAIRKANNSDSSTGGGLIVLPAQCNITISTPATATTGLPAITGDVTILGKGTSSVISRDPLAPAFRIFDVNSGATLTLRNLVVRGGNTDGLGGGIQNAGKLFLKNVTLSYNSAGNGGGLSVANGASANIYNSLFNFNSTTGVGGGAVINMGTLNIHHSHFTSNSAPINGGAINTQVDGITDILSSHFTHNTCGSLGGALSNLGVLNDTLSEIKFNTGSDGGGIATSNPNVNLNKTIITDNTPNNCSPLNTIDGCVG